MKRNVLLVGNICNVGHLVQWVEAIKPVKAIELVRQLESNFSVGSDFIPPDEKRKRHKVVKRLGSYKPPKGVHKSGNWLRG
jgi:hypothetical protein